MLCHVYCDETMDELLRHFDESIAQYVQRRSLVYIYEFARGF